MFKNPIPLVLASATALVLAVACGSSSTAAMDAGSDEDALVDSGHAADARGTLDRSAPDTAMDNTCVVMTCNGSSVTIPPGQTIPYGDVCGDTCKYQVQGMFGVCGCSVQPGCACM